LIFGRSSNQARNLT